jgi:aminopeptidase N
MENVACVTHSERMVYRSKVTEAERMTRAEVILHEMAHMWFGDLVTMRWWDDLWLNESFAEYMGFVAVAEATRFKTAWTKFANATKAGARSQDQLPTTHPIVADVPDVESIALNLDYITYNKGASAIQQLVAWIGKSRSTKASRRISASTRTETQSSRTFCQRWRPPPAGTSKHGRERGSRPKG